MQSYSSGNFESVKTYDFRKPKKFTKEHLRDLNNLNDSTTKILALNFAGMLRISSEVTVARIVEKRYGEFVNTLAENTFIGLITISNSNTKENEEDEAPIILHIPSTINFFMIDMLLGGSGEGCYFDRGYTEIEIEILKNFYQKITAYIEEAWSSLIDVKLSLDTFETNPKIIQSISANDSIVEIDYEVKLGEGNINTMKLCIPADYLDKYIGISDAVNKRNAAKRQNSESEKIKVNKIMSALSETSLELKAVLGTTELDLNEVLSLEKGDIIPLGTRFDGDVIISVDEVPWFSAKLGELKIKKAVKICDNIKKNNSVSYDLKF